MRREQTPEEIAERARQAKRTGYIRAIAVRVYCARLEDATGGGEGAVKRMLEADRMDGETAAGTKLRGRAEAYVPTVRATVDALGIPDVYLKEAAEVGPW
jgi:hypothetical protein